MGNHRGMTPSKKALQDEWKRVRHGVLTVWPHVDPRSLSEDEAFPWDDLVEMIRRTTGESVATVEAKLNHIIDRPSRGLNLTD